MSSFDRIVDMIDEKNVLAFPLTRDNISLENLTSNPEKDWNTRVTVNSKRTGEYVGSVNIYYTRANLTELGSPLQFMQEEPFTLESLCEIINKTKNCQITKEDLTIDTLPDIESGMVVTFTLSASATSLVWLGNTQVNILTGIPSEAKNLDLFLNTTLPALFAKK
jgi:hypothetical protein